MLNYTGARRRRLPRPARAGGSRRGPASERPARRADRSAERAGEEAL